jgi:hypothetical protein
MNRTSELNEAILLKVHLSRRKPSEAKQFANEQLMQLGVALGEITQFRDKFRAGRDCQSSRWSRPTRAVSNNGQ